MSAHVSNRPRSWLRWRSAALRLRTLPERPFVPAFRTGGPVYRERPGGNPTIRIIYLRPPDRVTEYQQELLLDERDLKISQIEVPEEGPPVRIGVVEAPRGGSVLWFGFPDQWHEVAAVFDDGGRLLGHYTNIVRPPEFTPAEWRITDLFLDVWQAADEAPVLLDEDELAAAEAAGSLSAADAEEARREARAILEAANAGRWPPPDVVRWTARDIRSLRYRRDAPGTWHANRIVGRIIAFGIYFLGLVSLTSVAFASLTDAFDVGGRALRWFVGTIAAEAAVLLPLALAGWLPATARPRLEESMTERTLFIGALVSGAAVLINPNTDLWRGALVGVYSVLALFLAIFGVCRFVFDRETPWMAIGGVAVSMLALLVLI